MRTSRLTRIVFSLIVLLLIAGCGKEPNEGMPGYGRIRVEVFDAPPPPGVEHIYLRITEVSVHSSDRGWFSLAQPNKVYDFLELIDGTTAVLADTTLEPGHYTQMRLVVGETNELVVDGQTYPLSVPSGAESGVKLNLGFDVKEDELIEILVDFDMSKSITWNPQKYLLHPTFKAFKKVISGTISGSVRDTGGIGIVNALVEAIGADDTVSTATDSTGSYKLILAEGTYDVQASAEGYTQADTTYTGVQVQAEAELTGYEFVLQP